MLIAAHLDPRRAPTQLRLSAPPSPFERRRYYYLLPLALLAVALGAVLAAQLTGEPAAGTGGPSAPAPGLAREEQSLAAVPDEPVELTESRSVTPALALTSQATPSASSSAAARKKPRDPWLD